MDLLIIIFLIFVGWMLFGIYTKLEDIEKLLGGEKKTPTKKPAARKTAAKKKS